VLFALSRFLWYFNFFWLIQNIYFLEKGMSFTQVSLLLGAWSLGTLILEIPSGIAADLWGRRNTLLISKCAFLGGLVFFIAMPSFWGFMAGMMMWAVNESFMSGAEEALVYDFLKENEAQSNFTMLLTIGALSREIGLGLGVLLAGFITHMGLEFNLLGSLVIGFLGIVPILFMKEPAQVTQSSELKFIHIFKEALHQIIYSISLKRIVLYSITTMLVYKVVSEYFTVSLNQLNISFQLIGVLAFLEMLFFALGGLLVHRIKHIANNTVYIVLTILSVGLLSFISLGSVAAVIVGFMLLRTIKAIGEIVMQGDWQKRITSESRATTTSFISFSSNVVYVIVAFLFGKSADVFGLFPSFLLMAVLSVMYIPANYILIKVHSNKEF
jgi:MFS family permease